MALTLFDVLHQSLQEVSELGIALLRSSAPAAAAACAAPAATTASAAAAAAPSGSTTSASTESLVTDELSQEPFLLGAGTELVPMPCALAAVGLTSAALGLAAVEWADVQCPARLEIALR